MKKLFLMAAMMLASAASFAQHAVGKFTIQPKVGINIANLTKSDADPRIGAVAGAEFEYRAADILGLSFGALYSQQGAKSTDDGATTTIKLDYINVPILANVYVAPGFAVKVGLQPGFNVSSKVGVKTSGASASVDMNDIKSIDFSIPVGMSYEFNNFVVDARYNIGVTKWADDVTLGDYTFNFSDSKHSVFQITLGYKFGL